ncbi:MAG: hypothetical protein F4207_11735 [Gemmatimonadetes bacterium]|nr:hypothetical protein [Gemmatimonadota bacterium]MYG17076.1 hypothetical protein [Gemmatimonadota bacterium]
MRMLRSAALSIDKSVARAADLFDFSRGRIPPGTLTAALWPGLVRSLVRQFSQGVAGVTGTNGKHTTCRILAAILQQADARTLHPEDIAPSIDEVVSTLVRATDHRGRIHADYGVFGFETGMLDRAIRVCNPGTLVLNNLYDDESVQGVDRAALIGKWCDWFGTMSARQHILVNADDPVLCGGFTRGVPPRLTYYGVEDERLHLADAATPEVPCPRCGVPLAYRITSLAHLGDYACEGCGWERPLPTVYAIDVDLGPDETNFRIITPRGPLDVCLRLSGLHNVYNAAAAAAAALSLGLSPVTIRKGLESVRSTGGRDERLVIHDREARLMTIKNRTSLLEALRTCRLDRQRGHFLFLLDEAVRGGRGGPWIVDEDLEGMVNHSRSVHVAGAGGAHLALMDEQMDPEYMATAVDVSDVFHDIMRRLTPGDRLWVLATEGAMYAVRRELRDMGII